uniref:Uncharacterized protein n=1 Tax=Glossina brevipalpis TaxID=37001 RepID=A0A1A9WBG2_9MUSC
MEYGIIEYAAITRRPTEELNTFAKIHLVQIYQQATVDDATALSQTLATRNGGYIVKRLFHTLIENLFQDIHYYFDNILIMAISKRQLSDEIVDCLRRIFEVGEENNTLRPNEEYKLPAIILTTRTTTLSTKKENDELLKVLWFDNDDNNNINGNDQ